MAVKAVAMDVKMAAALPGGVGNVSAFCRRQHINRSTFYKWRARVQAEGPDGLHERSRRPHTSPGATAAPVEDQIVRLRKELADNGDDHGPASIRDRLIAEIEQDARAGRWPPRRTRQAVQVVPSRATIARVLTRRGQVKAAPRKRPRSSYHRFQAARPNELWQSDWTGWHLANGRLVAIAGTLDDHARLLAGIGACHGHGTAELVWQVMSRAIENHGVPTASLTDNGRVYSLRRYRDAGQTAFEINLNALGCQVITSSPYHPQTCGKIERLWQTLKRWLTAHGPFATLAELNTALLDFAEHYNHHRPHRALHGHTPADTFAATTAARPAERPLPGPASVRHNHASSAGVVSAGRYAISLGRRWAGMPMTVIRDGDHITVFSGNQLVRSLDADPTRRHQLLHQPPGRKPQTKQ